MYLSYFEVFRLAKNIPLDDLPRSARLRADIINITITILSCYHYYYLITHSFTNIIIADIIISIIITIATTVLV